MRRIYINGFKKHEYYTQIIKLRILDFLFDWFIDCGEWFMYLHFNTLTIRFSGAGRMFYRHTKEEHQKWLKECHEFR